MNLFLKQFDIYFLVIANPDGYDLSLNVIFSELDLLDWVPLDYGWQPNCEGI